VANGETVITEDPVYSGLTSVLRRGGANLIGVLVGDDGIDLPALERTASREKPRLIVVTSNFQNPTGATLSIEAREKVLSIVRACGAVLVENDIYGDLVYEGAKLPTIRQLDDRGDTVLLRSFSKLAFPGLRTGWVIGPRLLIARLTEAKQVSDLHTDQLSQAVLLRFAASGRLAEHRVRVIEECGRRLRAALAACEEFLPRECSFTRPRGGMSLWIRLPRPLDAGELLARAERDGVNYLPGRVFGVSRSHSGALRLSFAQLAPEHIRAGIEILGRIFTAELQRVRRIERLDPAPAMV
jgi:2-aminoadipate transaminase